MIRYISLVMNLMMGEQNKGEIVIYENKSGNLKIDVKLEKETIWLTQAQMGQLFGKGKQTISEHIQNIFNESELSRDSVVRNFRTAAKDGKVYNTKYYNLDMIISVGYRVNSKRGTQFRIWASNILKSYFIQGYAINEKRLREERNKLLELQAAIDIFKNVVQNHSLSSKETKEIVNVISQYSNALSLLEKYDHRDLKIEGTTKIELFKIDYKDAVDVIDQLRKELRAGELFGNQKDESFEGSLRTVYQTYDEKELYPSIEEKAANLLYFIVKNHHFTDGNKRIAAFMFVWFLENNKLLYKTNGSKLVAENTLVALTLMIAESNPRNKDVMVKLVINLINNKN